MHKAMTGAAVPSTVTKRQFLRPTTSLSRPNNGQDTNASNLNHDRERPRGGKGVLRAGLRVVGGEGEGE